MSGRRIERTPGFTRTLERLRRAHPDLSRTVEEALRRYAEDGPPDTSHRIPGLGGQPVFKERLPLGNQGKRGGARIIYFADPDRVVALLIYTKSKRDDIPVKEIRDAFTEAGIRLESGDAPLP